MNLIEFKDYLSEKNEELEENLTSLFKMPLHPDITEAEIQVFLDDESGLNASFWIYFEGRNKKVDKTDKSLFPGRSLELIDLDFSEEFNDLNLQANLLKNWFVDFWKKQNGENYPIPVEIAVHDDFGDGKIIKLS